MTEKIDLDSGKLNDEQVLYLFNNNRDEFSAYVRGRAAIYENNLPKRKGAKEAVVELIEVPIVEPNEKSSKPKAGRRSRSLKK